MQTTVDIPAGALVVVYVCCTVANLTLAGYTISDGINSDYTFAVQSPLSASVQGCALYFCTNVAAIPSGTTFAISPSGSGAEPNIVSIAYVMGANGGIDATNSNNFVSSTGFSLATGALASDNEIAFAALNALQDDINGTTRTITGEGGFTEFFDSNTIGFNIFDFVYDAITTNTSWSPTWTVDNGPSTNGAVIATFMATPPPPPTFDVAGYVQNDW